MTKLAASLGGAQIQALRPSTNEVVAASGVDALATAIPTKVSVVRIMAISFAGTDPTLHMSINAVATTSSTPLTDSNPEYFKVIEDDVLHFIMGGTTPTSSVHITLMR